MTTFVWRGLLMTLALSLAALLPQGASTQPDVNALKKGVVRIRNTKREEVGTGIIVKVNQDGVYIVTAAHVVRGDASPEVYLFTRQKEPLRAMSLNMEDDDQKGLALLWLKADGQVLAGLRALSLGNSSGLDGGEAVTLLGFPGGTPIWTVTKGTVARREGREVVFTGSVTNGNSGGPLLLDGRVVGLVTVTVTEGQFSYAAQAESVAQYIRGIEPELADLSAKPTPTTTPRATPTPTPSSTPKIEPTFPPISPGRPSRHTEFCSALASILAASESGFNSIKGPRSANSSDHYQPTIYLKGYSDIEGWVIPDERAYYTLMSSKDGQRVELEYKFVVQRVAICLPSWENKEVLENYKYHRFREGDKGRVVSVYYNVESQNNGTYYLVVSIYPRGNSAW